MDKGFALIGVILIMVIFSVLGVTGAMMFAQEAFVTADAVSLAKAFYLAEAGVADVIYQLENDSGYLSSPTTVNRAMGDGTYSVAVNQNGTTYTLISTGSLGAIVRNVEEVVTITSGSPFMGAVAAKGSGGATSIAVRLTGQAWTNSYDSSQGFYGLNGNTGTNGHIMTNADIDTSGQSHIVGDVATGSQGSFNDISHVTGAITHDYNNNFEAPTVPGSLNGLGSSGDFILSGQNSQNIGPGDVKFDDVRLSGQSRLIVAAGTNIYITGNLNTSGQASMRILGQVNLYFDGDVSLSGQGCDNTSMIPSNFIMYGTGTTQNINLSGQGAMFAAINAPNAETTISGQGGVFGALITDTARITGQGHVHYDEDLQNLGGGGGGGVTYQSWREID